MRDRLYRGLLRRLQRWHLRFVLPEEVAITIPLPKPDHSHGHEEPSTTREIVIQEAMEFAQIEYRWMLKDAKLTIRAMSTLQGPSSLSLAERHQQQREILARKVVQMVRRRTRYDEPLAYILGTQPFGPLTISVQPPLLIPRPETEEWTMKVVAMIEESLAKTCQREASEDDTEIEPFRVLDLCCGTGCIGLTIAETLSNSPLKSSITLVDKNPSALECVRANINTNSLRSTLHTQIKTVQMDILTTPHNDLLDHFARLTNSKGFDLILCNPPYLLTADWEQLDPSVKNWEDRDALCGDHPKKEDKDSVEDGCAFYRRISELVSDVDARVPLIRQKPSHPIRQGLPAIVFEVGKGQHGQVKDILSAGGLFAATRIHIWQDALGVKRVVAGYLSPPSRNQ